MSKLLSRDDILLCTDEKFKDVEVPEWGGTVRVRSLTGLQRSQLLSAMSENAATEDWIERLVAACICNEKGGPLFSQDDVKLLKEKNSAALNRVFDAADNLNGISGKQVEEMMGE